MKGIYDLIMFVGIGGPISFFGGLIGYYFGLQAAQDCSLACLSRTTPLQVCFAGCPDPWQFAVYFALPGVAIAIIQWLIKRSAN